MVDAARLYMARLNRINFSITHFKESIMKKLAQWPPGRHTTQLNVNSLFLHGDAIRGQLSTRDIPSST